MTFDEWKKENWMYIDVEENAQVIWDAAQIAEREACAALAVDTAAGRDAEAISDAILKRANVI